MSKILPCLCYFARQGLPFRRHGIDSIFKQLLNFPHEDDLAFAEWLKKEVISTLPLEFKMKCCAGSYQTSRLSQYHDR